MIENLQREDLNPMEEAEGYLVLLTDFSMTQEEVAKRMGNPVLPLPTPFASPLCPLRSGKCWWTAGCPPAMAVRCSW